MGTVPKVARHSTARKPTVRIHWRYYDNVLAAHIATLDRLIIRICWSIDTVQILTSTYITEAHRLALQRRAGKVTRSWASRRVIGHYGIRLHQPSHAALEYLAKRFPDHVVTRFDIAVDCYCRSLADAQIVRNIQRLIITQPHRADRITKTCEDTGYLGGKWDGRNIAMYLKPELGYVARLELRYTTAKLIRERRAVAKATDLIGWDFRKFAPRDIRASIVNTEKADQLIAAKASELAKQRRFWLRYMAPRGIISNNRDRLTNWLRECLEHKACRMVSDDEYSPIPLWQDRANFPAQHVIDALPFLDKNSTGATLHKPLLPLINVDIYWEHPIPAVISAA